MNIENSVVICGAGIAGIATAYYLLRSNKDLKVVLIDKNQPLSFTTSKSGENFRDYWPQKSMRDFVSDSILLMEELKSQHGDHSFDMVKSGYNFVSHELEKPVFGTTSQKELNKRTEEITDFGIIRREYPYLDNEVRKIVRVKNAGKIDVFALGSLLLREAQKAGIVQVEGEILGIEKSGSVFKVMLDSRQVIEANEVVIAAGPFINSIAAMLGFEFPITNTLQSKFIIPDPQKLIPANMPFTIYADPQFLDWTEEEAQFFASEEKYKWLLNGFPGGLHIKPDSGGIKLGWAFQINPVSPTWEPAGLELFPQVVLKGASRFIPDLAEYENNIPAPLIEYSGHYTRTKENWPLIGPTEMDGVFVVGALAGYGTMAACAAGKLCSDYISGESTLPGYAENFHPLRYQNDAMIKVMNALVSDGQL